MFFIELPLVSGGMITFVTNGQNFVIQKSVSGQCVLNDGLHNNGGWHLALSYQEAVGKFRAAMLPTTQSAGPK